MYRVIGFLLAAAGLGFTIYGDKKSAKAKQVSGAPSVVPLPDKKKLEGVIPKAPDPETPAQNIAEEKTSE